LARFARDNGFNHENPVEVRFSRGFQAGSYGHGEGRAADIAAVGGKSLLKWKREWDGALALANIFNPSSQRSSILDAERARNLGYRLYKALQAHGGWRLNPSGWRVYRGVTQLFGPWTATEGPWKAMTIEKPSPDERRRLLYQRWVFRAHQDHIHVAR
jgi:hypothetical protein